MVDTVLVLGQSIPTANVLTALYTAPTATVASSISACNQDSSNWANFSWSIAVGGASDNPKQYKVYLSPISPNNVYEANIGITLATGDVIRVLSTTGNVSFTLLGVQIT